MKKPTALRIANTILWVVCAFYAYGAIMHVMNMTGLNNFDWAKAPLKWQILDIAYLLLDVVVVIGLPLGWVTGYVAYFSAAVSQIVLCTLLRDWILDVPVDFAPRTEEIVYLDGLIAFHSVTVAFVVYAIWLRQTSQLRASS